MNSIQLITSTIHSLKLDHYPIDEAEGKTRDDRTFDLDYTSHFTEGELRRFANVFTFKLIHPGEFALELEYVSWFSTTEDIDEAFKASSFIKVNVPAIAFPYLRSTVSMLTLTAGYPSAVLPTINFVEFSERSGVDQGLQ